ncbi:phosphate system positive regulatory protein pho81 [Coemansia sp. Benny D115]|nr:phosphate system positive regulatory protein pho81 [Coemansia sp. Benny D115]
MKFGKHIQAQTIPEWAAHYMSYKGLKKIINELSAPLSPSASPGEAAKQRLQTVKAAFFFQVDRELEKVNHFYLQKEHDAKERLKSLIEKQRTLQSRGPRNRTATIRALREAFLNSRHGLDKLQNFIEINSTGFRKILKKWDKRSKSSIKELYLARQVDVQPCFNKDVIAELSDTVTKCLSELEHALEEATESIAPAAMPTQLELLSSPSLRSALYAQNTTQNPAQSSSQPQVQVQVQVQTQPGQLPASSAAASTANRRSSSGFLLDDSASNNAKIDHMEAVLFGTLLLESTHQASDAIAGLVAQNTAIARSCLTRVLWRACSELKDEDKQRMLLDSNLADLHSIDDINERTLAHEAAIHGSLSIMQAVIAAGVSGDEADYYGRRPAHYAAMNGHSQCVRHLLEHGCYTTEATDDDGNRAFDYAVSNNHVESVRLLLAHDPSVARVYSPDHPVLISACERGHASVASILLEAGAEIMPNSQGINPVHIAARNGFSDILRMLLARQTPVDAADKDLGWTPLFYAASEGNIECIRILIEASCDLEIMDENKHLSVYYAANEGHLECVDLLLDAASRARASRRAGTEDTAVDDGATEPAAMSAVAQGEGQQAPGAAGEHDAMMDLDLDGIPSLSLPPPLIPFRVYGHNFLGKQTRIQIRMLSQRGTDAQPVTFFDNRDMLSLKLVVMAKPDAGMVPQTVTLPLETSSTTFGFQTDDPRQFRLEFFLYPSFGLQPIGKAVALPSMFNCGTSSGVARLPLLDRYMKLVAEVAFEYLVVRPFQGAPLQIGGKVDTYWRSTNPGPRQNAGAANPSVSSLGLHRSPLAAATLRTPLVGAASVASPLSAAEACGSSAGFSAMSLVVSSSLAAEHVCVQVQVCRDGVPVVSPRVVIDIGSPTGVKLSICSLTHTEFQKIMRSPAIRQTPRRPNAHGGECQPPVRPHAATGTAAEWYRYVQDSGFTLKEVLELLPGRLGVSIQVLYNSRAWSSIPSHTVGLENAGIPPRSAADLQDVNGYIDAILKVVYDDSLKGAGAGSGSTTTTTTETSGRSVLERVASNLFQSESSQRNTIFCSYSPQVCIALNWKQPNYAVFLLTSGREPSPELESAAQTASGDVQPADAPSFRPPSHHLSLKEAVRFACTNNLLGIICNSSLLTRVPELICSVKDNGLFLVSFGRENYDEQSCALQKAQGVDAIMRAGVIGYDADEAAGVGTGVSVGAGPAT